MTERKKNVKVSALLKMETFLNAMYLGIGKGETFSLDALAREHKLSGSVATLIKRQNIVNKLGPNNWQWAYPTGPDRSLAVTILDEVNRYNGNWKDKNPMLAKALNQSDAPKDLFSSAKDRSDVIYIAGCIASGMYANSNIVGILDLHDDVEGLNKTITFAAYNLINKINNPKNL